MKEETSNSLFTHHFDVIKIEIEDTQKNIKDIERLSLTFKTWTILVWAGSTSLLLTNEDNSLRDLIKWTIFFPITFWILEAANKLKEKEYTQRLKEISDYLNSEKFIAFAKNDTPQSFTVYSIHSYNEIKYNWKSILYSMFPFKVRTFYISLVIATICLTIILKSNYSSLNKAVLKCEAKSCTCKH